MFAGVLGLCSQSVVDHALSARFIELMKPSATDIRRAKRAIMRFLDDGIAHRSPALLVAGADELGSPRDPSQLEVRFPIQPDPAQIREDDPAVAYVRARLAARWAIAELAATQLAIPVLDPGGSEPTDDLFSRDVISITIRYSGGAFGVHINLPRPAIEGAYIQSPLAASEPKWYLDPDVFSEDLADLELDDRAKRTLQESLEAFRRRLYLASAALLGVVSEAAWYQAAERLGKPGRLEAAFGEERTATIQKLVADHLRQKRVGSGTMPDELLANAALLRELRNYGVHRAKMRDDLDRYFNEEECGLLILRTHNYLVRLAGAVRLAMVKGS